MSEANPTDSPQLTVGVVGLGAMGLPIAGHLARAGVPVVVADLDEAAVRACVAQGMTAADGPAELAARSDVVLVVVPSDDDVRAVCDGDAGLLAGCPAGHRGPAVQLGAPRHLRGRDRGGPAGVAVLDAALTGGVRGAENGQINLLVGGDPAALDRVRPALAAWTSSVHHLGPLGAGQVGKTVNNLIHWAQIAAIVESLELGRRYGLDVPTLRRALLDGPTASRTLAELEQMRFTWHAKDLANAEVMAEAVGLPLPVAATSRTAMTAITVPQVAELLTASGTDQSSVIVA